MPVVLMLLSHMETHQNLSLLSGTFYPQVPRNGRGYRRLWGEDAADTMTCCNELSGMKKGPKTVHV